MAHSAIPGTHRDLAGAYRLAYCTGMARPLTKGPTIWFRLPIALDAELSKRAEARGESRNQYVARYFERALAQSANGDAVPASVVASGGVVAPPTKPPDL
jgi:hypothetical protein